MSQLSADFIHKRLNLFYLLLITNVSLFQDVSWYGHGENTVRVQNMICLIWEKREVSVCSSYHDSCTYYLGAWNKLYKERHHVLCRIIIGSLPSDLV